VAALVLVVGGAIVYFVKGANAKLTTPFATIAINQILKAQPPAVIKFSTGTLVSSVNEKATDPHYKLLAKIGVITVKPKAWNSIYSTMTPAGEKLLSTINGVEKGTNKKDNTVTYVVPLAERKLVEINDIKMINPHMAQVDYTWQWVPNRLGRDFDATGEVVKGFNTWDRQTLINTYGVNFYNAAPTKVRIVLMQTKDDSWKPYVE
jgi:ribosomal protein L11